jgi:hypothetical protein
MDTTPTRDRILRRIHTILPKEATGDTKRGIPQLTVVTVDVQAIMLGRGIAWVAIIECTGALLGEENNLVYSHMFGEPGVTPNPRMPTQRTIDTGITEACTKLRGLRVLQLRAHNNLN